MNLAAGPAGTGLAHLPEVVLFAQTDNPFFRHIGNLTPQVMGFIVILVDGDIKLLFRQFQFLSQEVPRIGDGFPFEIIAKGEVPQHFKKGMMPRCTAYRIQVVMLPAGAHAFLRCGGSGVIPLFQAQEHILELVHPRIGEQQRRIIIWHQRGTGHMGMSL